jgi:hypothetical protein
MMMRRSMRAAIAGLLPTLLFAPMASSQVRDAVYRGTLVCDKLPFFETAAREAIEVSIKGSVARYIHIVRERTETSFEVGTGTLEGQTLSLKGGWSGESESYESNYGGAFVRRSARLTGTQTWTHEGKTYTRKCEGAIKRPFAVFLPGEAKE